MSSSFWQYHRNIETNITDNCHFAFVYLLGKLDYSLYGQRNKNSRYIWLFRTNKNPSEIKGWPSLPQYHTKSYNTSKGPFRRVAS